MSDEYRDARITCTADGIAIRGYYIPWGTKHIGYDSIRSMQRVNLGALTGRARLWGTANPSRWANFDHRRPFKTVGFDLDLGATVKPLLTPDDPDAFEHAVRAHLDPIVIGSGARRSSIV
jgi:hypothetical protein